MSTRHQIFGCLCVMTSVTCGSGTSPGGGNGQLSVGGTYDTAVSLLENNCGSVTVQPNPTIVTHEAGASTLAVTHAGNTYSGSIQNSGAFSTLPKALGVAGSTVTLTIAGEFSKLGFDARVTVEVQQAVEPSTCRYVVHWVGTKRGLPNVIPG